MKKVSLIVLLICAFAVSSGLAGIISHTNVTYVKDPGYPTAGASDATGDCLANGYLNGVEGDFSLSSPDWVKYQYGPGAKITFNLGAKYNLETVVVGYLLAPTWGVPAPVSMDVSFSNDGVNYTTAVNMTGFQSVPDAGWVAEAVEPSFSLAGKTGQYVTIIVNSPGYLDALFLGEFTFSGTPVPEPATMLLLGLGSLAMLRKKN